MKTDRYTQFILTVIAFCLILIAFRDGPEVVTTAHAAQANGPVQVDIVRINGQEFGFPDMRGGRLAELPVRAK